MRHEHDPEPRITLGTVAGGAACAFVLWLWLWFMAFVEAALLP
jgi:hypothetical protein